MWRLFLVGCLVIWSCPALGAANSVARDPEEMLMADACRYLILQNGRSLQDIQIPKIARFYLLYTREKQTVGDVLAGVLADELETIPNINPKYLNATLSALSNMGLTLRTSERLVPLAPANRDVKADQLALWLAEPLDRLHLSPAMRDYVKEHDHPRTKTIGSFVQAMENQWPLLDTRKRRKVISALAPLGLSLDRRIRLNYPPIPNHHPTPNERNYTHFEGLSTAKKLAADICLLGLGSRATAALRDAELHTIADLRSWTAAELDELTGFNQAGWLAKEFERLGIPLLPPNPRRRIQKLHPAQKRALPVTVLKFPAGLQDKIEATQIQSVADLVDLTIWEQMGRFDISEQAIIRESLQRLFGADFT